MSKACTTCGIEKPLSDYQNHTGGLDGKRSQCKVCRNEYIRKRNGLPPKPVYAERKHPDATPPRTFNHLLDEPWDGKLGAMYVRNDGNKHIKSRGM